MQTRLNRRETARYALAALAAASTLSGCATRTEVATHVAPAIVKPPPLRPGDTIGLFNASGALPESGLAPRVRALESLGFKVKVAPNLLARWGGYAGTVDQRVDDFHALWRDPEVRGLWAARGGSGAAAMLPHLDYALFRANPKVVVGYSDVTALHLGLWQRSGLVSFHGPTAGSQFTPFMVANLRRVLMGETVDGTNWRAPYLPAPEHTERATAEPAFQKRVFETGVAIGRLWGGNLSVLSAMVGSPYVPSVDGWRDSLLFLEEVDEVPYRVDRMLTHLQLQDGSGHALSRLAGLMLGVFSRCDPKPGDESLSLMDVLSHHAQRSARARRVPASYGNSFGHVASQWLLPVGVQAEFDAGRHQLRLLEHAVEA
jgi:muramoyltetrapeptide carboxypeptidase